MQEIFLVDSVTGNFIQLDVEESAVEIKYQIADIADIEQRKDTISKTIQLKSTKQNDYAFGHLFLLNRNYQSDVANKLFFNYNPLRKVDCLVYENNLLILKGYMVITQWNRNNKGEIYYSATIQGSAAGLKDLLSDKKLSDLDLSDMKHSYNWLTIVDSWGGLTSTSNSIGNSRTTWTDSNGNEYTKPFQLGVGYVYASIDYADRFVDESLNQNYDKIKVQNFRPQVYAAEYLKRILKNVGYTYEVQGAASNIEKFNRLIIPSTSPDMFVSKKGVLVQFEKGIQQTMTIQNFNGNPNHISNFIMRFNDEKKDVIPICFKSFPLMNNDLLCPNLGKPYPWQDTFNDITNTNLTYRYNNAFRVTRDMKTSIKTSLNFNTTNLSPSGLTQNFSFQIVKRKGTLAHEDDSNSFEDWEVIAEVQKAVPFITPNNGTYTPQAMNVEVIAHDVELFRLDEIMVRLVVDHDCWLTCVLASNAGYIRLSKDSDSYVLTTSRIDDKVIPQAPNDLGQFDFFKSLLLLMNMYCHSSKDNNKHLILKSYDDFYALASPLNLAQTALNFTNRIDYSKGLEAKSNINLPKKYTFSFLEDSDYLNSRYKALNNEVYGTLKFNDSYGTADEKKIELKFAPTPPAKIDGVDRYLNFFTSKEVSLTGKEKMQVKPRILIYSGVYGCNYYKIYDEHYQDTNVHWVNDYVDSIRYYPLASTYWFRTNEAIQGTPFNANGTPKVLIPKDDLMFWKPKTYFFNADANFQNLAKNGFQNYYVGQVSELTNGNVFTLTCHAKIDSYLIANMDLQQPIFIDMGEQGYAYFKILNVDYGGENSMSKIQLQKII